MPDIERLRKNLEANGFRTVCFDTGEEVRAYLDRELDGVTIGFGGSETSWKLGLYQLLSRHNQCRWVRMGDAAAEAVNAPCYICSLNGVAETGELVNIDGNGNRVAATLYGKEKLYFIIGRNKIAPDLHAAIDRARNIAGPLNARRLEKKTPCVCGEPRCHDCASPERICAAMVVYWKKPTSIREAEVIIVNQDLGY